MANITCVRCSQERQQLGFRPFPNPVGQRVFDSICQPCWGDWLKHQQALINHYGLDVRNPEAKQFLYANLEQYLFGSEK